MAVFRLERTGNFTVMSNYHLRDTTLSLKAKGLLSQMLSLPEDWAYSLRGLASINKESLDAIRETIRELEAQGYLRRKRERDENGHLRGTVYTIFECPSAPSLQELSVPVQEDSAQDFSTQEDSTQERPTLENPTLEKTTQLNTELPNKEKEKKERKNTDLFNIDSFPSKEEAWEASFAKEKLSPYALERYRLCREEVRESIEYEMLQLDYSSESLDEIVELITETLCSQRNTLRVGREELPAVLVKDRFRQLEREHIDMVLENMGKNTTAVRDIRQYLLTALYRAPVTLHSHYAARINHDLYAPFSSNAAAPASVWR